MAFAIADIIGGSPNYGDIAAQQEAQRQARITQGTAAIDQAFSGFNPAFYKQRAQAYVDFAMPKVAEQYRNARNDIGFNLANRGLIGGSAAAKQWGDLATAYGTAQQNIQDTGTQQAQQLQTSVENAKNTELSFLYQSADPAQAGQQATASAASFSTPTTFPAVAQQFTDLLNQYYYSQLVNAYKPTSFVALPPSYTSTAPLGASTQSIGGP